ncbi:hypothetical protein RQP46_010234 [Phenoliferia psychrophenolica]
MVSFRTISLLTLASCATADLLNLDLVADVLGLAGAVIKPGSAALIDINAILGILAPTDCPADAAVGVQASVAIGSLLRVCLCVKIIGNSDPNQTPCPACVPHSTSQCNTAAGSCVCVCDAGYTASASGTCEPIQPVTASTAAKRKRAQLLLESEKYHPSTYNADRCPNGETACPFDSLSGGFECLDTTTSLDSCGGCPGKGGQNCLNIEGALNVQCVNSACEITSCYPGWHYMPVIGRCVSAALG